MGVCSFYYVAVLLVAIAITEAAWVTSSPPNKARLSTVALNQQPTETSRREWLGGIGSAAFAAALGLTSVSANPKPASAVSTVTTTKTTATVCDPSVSVWTNPSNGRKVYLLGTAHISSASAELAGKIVEDVAPEAVFIELDAKRVGGKALIRQEGSTVTDTEDLLEATSKQQNRRSGLELGTSDGDSSNTLELMATADPSSSSEKTKPSNNPFRNAILAIGSKAINKAISGMYRNMNDAGFQAGEEFANAVRAGQKIGSKIVLGDRDVDVTLRRLTEALASSDVNKMAEAELEMEEAMKAMLPSSSPATMDMTDFTKDEMTVYVETIKAKDNVRTLIGSLKKSAPTVYNALVGERDQYMASGLDRLDMFPSIVAVMGIAHIDGVENNLSLRGWKPAKLACGLKKRG